MPLTEKKAAHPANKNADKFNIFLNIGMFLRPFSSYLIGLLVYLNVCLLLCSIEILLNWLNGVVY